MWALYVDDLGRPFVLHVEADDVRDWRRGWVISDDITVLPLPRDWRPRRVVGIDRLGFARTAVVARRDAPLWTGQAESFVARNLDFQMNLVKVTRRLPETRGPMHDRRIREDGP